MATNAATNQSRELLDRDFISKLDQLSLVSRKILAGKMRGERISKRRGESAEFADYRNYVSGDDLRFLDWNIYARLNQLFVKLFFEEEDLHVSLLIDASKSMDWGDPNKGLHAARIAAAVAYIGLLNLDRVSVYTYADGLRDELIGMRGRRSMHRVIDYLTSVTYDGPGDLAKSARQFATQHPQKGIVIVLSDFLEKGGYEEALRILLARQYDLYLLQILCPEEIDPPLVGDIRLVDCEDEEVAEVSISQALLKRYKQKLDAYCHGLRDYCSRRGINYMFTNTAVPFDQIVLSYFRKRGLVR